MNNSRKRDKPYHSRHALYSLPKRRRPLPLDADAGNDDVSAAADDSKSKALTSVLVIGVPSECSILDIKSRFEMYGSISRTRMEPNGVAYINFRSGDSAQEAIKAARDSSFPITLQSVPVQVMWANDPIPQWKKPSRIETPIEGLSSKLVRAELPLRRHGRGTKLSSTIVNPRDENNSAKDGDNGDEDKFAAGSVIGSSTSVVPFKGREVIAYDDIL